MKMKILGALTAVMALGILGGVGWFFFRTDSAVSARSHLESDLSAQELAEQDLFKDLGGRYASLSKKRMRWRHFVGSVEKSERPAEINWAADIYDAIERATAEDKPIFFITYCRENGCQDRDV